MKAMRVVDGGPLGKIEVTVLVCSGCKAEAPEENAIREKWSEAERLHSFYDWSHGDYNKQHHFCAKCSDERGITY